MIPKLSNEHYHKLWAMLFDAIPSSVLLISRDLRIISANRNFLEKSRRNAGETVGHRLEEVFPAGILDYTNIVHRIQQVFETRSSSQGERITYRAPGLPMRFYYYRAIPFVWQGTVESSLLLMDDVTEQVRLSEEVRRIERHLVSVVESASDIVLSTDTRGRILTWNSAAEKLSGFKLYEVRERFFHEYCAEPHQEDAEMLFHYLQKQRESLRREWNLKVCTGASIPVAWVFSPMKGDEAETIGIVAVGRDLTEQRKLEMQLAQSQKLAALGVMAGGIAHEIRNPLAICSSAAQFLMEETIPPSFRQECAEKIQSGIEKASLIIENLLRFARPAARTDLRPIELIPVLLDTQQLIDNQARIQKIELRHRWPTKPVMVNGIANLLQQVFINLFLNAINAMPNGGVLNVEMEPGDRDVAVRVIDNGCGIPESAISKIFDPFYTTSAVGKGTGLGLSICYSIVKEHRGLIEVESVVGKGTTFIVRLPLVTPSVEACR